MGTIRNQPLSVPAELYPEQYPPGPFRRRSPLCGTTFAPLRLNVRLNPSINNMPDSYLVIGGCGFLGRHIVEQLLARGESEVAVFDIVQRHFDR